jgi:hypothetical protein
VSVALVIPNNGVWTVSNTAFRLLAQEATELLERPEDRKVLAVGQAVNGLFLDQLEPDQARRVASAMQAAADALGCRLRTSGSEWNLSFAESLDDLALRLTELADTGEAF